MYNLLRNAITLFKSDSVRLKFVILFGSRVGPHEEGRGQSYKGKRIIHTQKIKCYDG